MLVSGLVPSAYPRSHWLDLCKKELMKGFGNQSWMRLRVAAEHRDSILATLQNEWPQYTFSKYEVTFIWIEGDLDVHINACEDELRWHSAVFESPQRFIVQVKEALQRNHPQDTFKIGTFGDDKRNKIIMNNHKYK